MVEETVKVIKQIEERADGIVDKAKEESKKRIQQAEDDAALLIKESERKANAGVESGKELAAGKEKLERKRSGEKIDREIEELREKAASRKERAVNAVIQNLID